MESESNGAKGLIDQIRTVHLALTLVAFVLLATSLQEPQRKIERSIKDARAIYTLATTLDLTAGDVGDKANHLVEQYAANSRGQLQTGPLNLEITWPDGTKQVFELLGLVVTYLSDGQYEGEDDIENPAYSYIPFHARSLADFVRFWDHNATEQMIVVPKVTRENIKTIELGSTKAKSFRILPASIVPKKYLRLHAGVEGNSLQFFTYPNAGEPAITVEVPLTKIPGITVQALLIEHAQKKQEWLQGKFAIAFPELNDRAKNLKSLDLLDLVTELNENANREQDRIELFGAKIDAPVVARWGILILAMCQLYLWLHLQALLPVVAKTSDSLKLGWIGLYRGHWAAVFTIFSLLLPPVVAVCWTARQWGSADARWPVLSSVNALVCAVMGFATIGRLIAIRKESGKGSSSADKPDPIASGEKGSV